MDNGVVVKSLFIMCGLPFSGKTTLASSIAAKRHAVLISLDEINESRGLRFGGEGAISQAQWQETHQIALSRLAEALSSDADIVIDDTNCFRFLRDNYRRLADAAGYRTVVVLVDTSTEEIKRRIFENRITKKRRHVMMDVLDNLITDFQWPTDDESCISPATLFSNDLKRPSESEN